MRDIVQQARLEYRTAGCGLRNAARRISNAQDAAPPLGIHADGSRDQCSHHQGAEKYENTALEDTQRCRLFCCRRVDVERKVEAKSRIVGEQLADRASAVDETEQAQDRYQQGQPVEPGQRAGEPRL